MVIIKKTGTSVMHAQLSIHIIDLIIINSLLINNNKFIIIIKSMINI